MLAVVLKCFRQMDPESGRLLVPWLRYYRRYQATFPCSVDRVSEQSRAVSIFHRFDFVVILELRYDYFLRLWVERHVRLLLLCTVDRNYRLPLSSTREDWRPQSSIRLLRNEDDPATDDLGQSVRKYLQVPHGDGETSAKGLHHCKWQTKHRPGSNEAST